MRQRHTGPAHTVLVFVLISGHAADPCLKRYASALAAYAVLFDDFLITTDVLALDVIKELTALRHHFQEAAARMVVFFVHLEVVG